MNDVLFRPSLRLRALAPRSGDPRSDAHPPCLAVTGGIACGKSAFGRMLAELGADVVDADEIVHELQLPGQPLARAIYDTFGPECIRPDGAVDRPALARLVFGHPDKLATLNRLSHPLVRERLDAWRREPTCAWARACLVPLLFETGWERDWDATLCVACSHETQLQRLLGRGLDAETARQRIAAQMPPEEKAARADIVVRNDGSLGDLRAAALLLRQRLQDTTLR